MGYGNDEPGLDEPHLPCCAISGFYKIAWNPKSFVSSHSNISVYLF